MQQWAAPGSMDSELSYRHRLLERDRADRILRTHPRVECLLVVL